MTSGADDAPELLTAAEMDLWHAWRRANDVVGSRVLEEVTTATGLSPADIAVLIRLDDAGGVLPQSRLTELLGWDRSRLSHQLTRMQSRDLLERRKDRSRPDVALRPPGRAAIEAGRPVHAAAVRRHLLEPLGESRAHELHEALTALAPTER